MELRELGVLMKSVPPQQHAAFVSLLAALSLVAIYTLGLSTSFYRLYYEIAVPGGSGLVVSSYAASPITSVIDRSLVEKLLGNATGAQVEYAVFSIAYVGGRLVVVRGLDRGLAAFPDSGELCYYCAVVGGELAEDLNVSEGSLLPLHSVLSGRSVLIYVYRVEDLPPPYRYEVLCGTDLVRELRGIGKNSYSIAVVKSENLSVLRELAAKLGIGESEVGILRRALLVLTQRGLRTVLEVRKDLPEVYIGRLGIHRELLYYLTYSTAAVSMLCLPIAGETVVRVGKVAARTLRSIGVSRARLTLALAAQASLYSTISITLATATTRILSSYLVFKILSYSVTPATRIGEVLMVAAIQVALLSLGVLWGIREHVE